MRTPKCFQHAPCMRQAMLPACSKHPATVLYRHARGSARVDRSYLPYSSVPSLTANVCCYAVLFRVKRAREALHQHCIRIAPSIQPHREKEGKTRFYKETLNSNSKGNHHDAAPPGNMPTT